MKTSAEGRKFIAKWEGNILKAYKDSVGVWTIGVGHTSAAGEPKVSPGMTITATQSDEILTKDLADVEKQVMKVVKVPLTQNQFDMLVSFTFNVGGGALAGSTLLKKLNTKDYKGAADQFLAWNKGTIGGKKVRIEGLANRRAAERKVFLVEDTVVVPEAPVEVPTKPVEPIVEPKASEVPVFKTTSWWDILAAVVKAVIKR
jgi:lysozyme